MLNKLVCSTVLCSSVNLFGNIQVCNYRDHTVYASIAYTNIYEENGKNMRNDSVHGWWMINPQNCSELSKVDGKTLVDGRVFLRIEHEMGPEMKNPRYLICFNTRSRFDFTKIKEHVGTDTAVSPTPCSSLECNHPTLSNCDDLEKPTGGEEAYPGLFEEYPVTTINATLDLR